MSRIISNPSLPPKEGFVEIELSDGSRVYQPTPEQIKKERQEKLIDALKNENADLKETVDTLLAVTPEVTP